VSSIDKLFDEVTAAVKFCGDLGLGLVDERLNNNSTAKRPGFCAISVLTTLERSMGDTDLAIPGISLIPRPCQGRRLFHSRTTNFEDFGEFLEKFGRAAAALSIIPLRWVTPLLLS
jgi:hypothetical protein